MNARDLVLRRNNVNVTGADTDRTIVFAHGFGCDQNMWRFVTPAFERTHRLVLFDYVGCGHSDATAFTPGRYGSLDGYARDLLEVCDALELRGATLVAHSVSAMVGLLASIEQPGRFSRVVMIGPSPCYINDPPYVGGFERKDMDDLLTLMDHNYIGWATFLAPVVMGPAAQPQRTAELEQSFCSTDPVTAKTFARATFYADNRADLARATVPSLIVQIRDDAIAPMAVGEYLREHMPASELTVLEASGHCPHMSHPELTIEVIREFVERA